MPLSDIASLVRNPITTPAAVLRTRVTKDAEVPALRHEDAALRRHRQLAARTWTFVDRQPLCRVMPKTRNTGRVTGTKCSLPPAEAASH
ncbi:hypothetical protein [Streptomyces sp. NBC_00483]|uniref:hypothetical protein n=1 Tax=Streptomyces sp. NBC_00483 TaxID=2975756 RepID=UPI002E17E680